MERKQLPIFSLHAAGQGELLDKFFRKLAFDDIRYLKQDSRDFALVVLTSDGIYQAMVSCKNSDMKNFAIKRGKEYIEKGGSHGG